MYLSGNQTGQISDLFDFGSLKEYQFRGIFSLQILYCLCPDPGTCYKQEIRCNRNGSDYGFPEN